MKGGVLLLLLRVQRALRPARRRAPAPRARAERDEGRGGLRDA